MLRDEKKGPTFEEMIEGYIAFRTKKEQQYEAQKKKQGLASFYDERLKQTP